MLKPFTTFFSFLLNHNPIRRRRRPNRLFSSNSINDSLVSSSFMHMGVSNQFKQVFNLIDTNGDGKISAAELTDLLVCLGHAKKRGSAAATEAEGMVRVLDFNGDGFVDLQEFMVVMSEAKHNGISEREKEEEELMDAFLMFDRDRNGLISARELRRVMVNLGCHDCSIRECKRMIKGVDQNGDGFVDFQEFRSMMRSSTSSGVANV